MGYAVNGITLASLTDGVETVGRVMMEVILAKERAMTLGGREDLGQLQETLVLIMTDLQICVRRAAENFHSTDANT